MDQGKFSDPDFICGTHQMESVQFADKLIIFCRKLKYEISHLIICMWGVYFRQKYDKSCYLICQLYYTCIYTYSFKHYYKRIHLWDKENMAL